MRRLVIGASTLAAALLLAAPLSAQFFVGGYATLPQSDFKDYAKTGWMVAAGWMPYMSADARFGVWLEGEYGSNTHEGNDNEKTNILMGLVTPSYNLTQGSNVTPYLLGSVGYLSHMYKAGDSGFADETEGGLVVGGGLGVGFNKKFWVDGRYMTASIKGSKTAFLLIGAGVNF
jgi:hypothetical protein